MDESVQSPYYNNMRVQYKDGSHSLERLEEPYTATGKEKIHTMLDGETLQSLAFKHFGDSGLWYRIADANDIIDPFTEIHQGKQIMIPKI